MELPPSCSSDTSSCCAAADGNYGGSWHSSDEFENDVDDGPTPNGSVESSCVDASVTGGYGGDCVALASVAARYPRHIVEVEGEIVPGVFLELTSSDVVLVNALNPLGEGEGIWPLSITIAGCGEQLVWRDDVVLRNVVLEPAPPPAGSSQTADCKQQ